MKCFNFFHNLYILFIIGFFFHCTKSYIGTEDYLRFGNAPDIIAVYKVADRKMSPKDPCCRGKRYSMWSYFKDDIYIHLMFSKDSRISKFVYKTHNRQFELPEAGEIYKMINSPLVTCLTINPAKLGILIALDSLGNNCFNIDLSSKVEEIKNLKHAIEKSNGWVDYDKIPDGMFAEHVK
jgi:hypothetical protein